MCLPCSALAGPKGYVISWVERELNALGFTDEQLMVGGYIIKTTLVKEAQEAAVAAVNQEAPTKAPENLHIGLISIKPGTGEISAMYGGKDYLKYQFNAATQGIASGGSSFKSFALVAALEAGIPLAGGHSIDSPEPIFGLAVNGIVDVCNLKKTILQKKEIICI